MGGILSGNPYCRKHDSTAQRIRLDSFQLADHVRQSCNNGRQLTMSWNNGNSISLTTKPDTVAVGYHIKDGRERIEDIFYLSFVPNNYGGPDRVYFICPFCGERVRYLYINHKHFCCRRCAGLTYPSQRVTKGNDECTLKMKKAIARLDPEAANTLSPIDLSDHWPQRPKGMHHQTYWRLMSRVKRAQREYWGDFVGTVNRRFGGCLGDFT